MDEDIQEWVEKALDDMDAAEGMLKIHKYAYVLFCCQQAVEKMIKALIIKLTEEMPLRSHDLMKLAGIAGIKPDEERELFYKSLTAYYVESRYPDKKGALTRRLTEESSISYLEKTKAELTWLQQLIQK